MAGKKKEKLAAFNRATILEAANALFLEKGVDGTTMDDIARTAEYSKTTLYAYFKSKEDIFNHIILEGAERYRDLVRQAAEKENSFEEFYFELCRIMISLHDFSPVYFKGMGGKILCSEEDTKNDEVLRKIYLSGEELNNFVVNRALKGVAEGELEISGPVGELVVVFWFGLSGIIEKTSNKGDYIRRSLGKTRNEFLQFAFETLFQLLVKRKRE